MIKKYYKRLDSTNVKAWKEISAISSGEALPEPIWFQAEDQYKGKGLGENQWYSESGKNITGSLAFSPSFLGPDRQFEVSIAASLAVFDLLSLYVEDIRIKWPNDILVDSKKIAGLLVEHTLSGTKILNTVIGIGLNVNQDKFLREIPDAVSLGLLLGNHLNIEDLTDLLLSCLENRLEQLENSDFEKTRKEYKSKLFRFKEFAPFKSENKWFRGRINDIDKFGRLVIETEEGELKEFAYKEVEFMV